ncbi:hypothetical protein AMECASPLE_034160 [Ameca splendens]|uniref:Uncharacterized protein n=1 Tax=Ameca splendens TaxID=208324 RepID=A0ABV0YU17_9TELE
MEELLHLSHLSSAIPEHEVQQEGRRLSQRCMILRNLLISSGPVSVEQLQLALQWQYELLRTSHVDLSSETIEDNRLSDFKWNPSQLNHTAHESRPEAGNYAATLLSPSAYGLVSADWKQPSVSSFHSGYGGVGSTQLESSGRKHNVENLPKLMGNSELMRAAPGQANIHEESISSISDSEHNLKEFGSGAAANFSSASIQIIPEVEAQSLNSEIKVKCSAAPPTNPWLSLPVDDLKNSYTVTIDPKPTPQKKEASWKQGSECSITADQESGSSEQLTQMKALSCTEPREPQSIDWILHTPSGLDDPEMSPICNILSSTITEGRDKSICGTEEVPTLLWDSYDLHDEKPEADSMMDMSLTDWEVKEQENLREVERILKKADGILEEEEDVLAQEAVLDALLRAGNKNHLWPVWHSEERLDEASIELSEVGVLSFEDCLQPGGSNRPNKVLSTQSMRKGEACSDDDEDFCSEAHNTERQFNSWLDLLNKMRNVHVFDELIIEENLKIHDLRRCKGGSTKQPSESRPFTSQHSSVTNPESEVFWLQLEREKREVEELEKSLDEEPERLVKARESRKCFVMEQSETDSGEDAEPTELLSEGSESGCNAAMQAQAKDVIKEKPSLYQGHNVSDSDSELSLCNTSRISSFCDLKESSEAVQPQIVCGEELNESTLCSAKNKLTSEMLQHEGEFCPGGKSIPLPLSEPETGSLPVNSPPAEHETPRTSKTCESAPSLLAQDPAYALLDLTAKYFGVLSKSVTINGRKNCLSPNVKEQINNNNNNLLVHGNCDENVSEMTNIDKEDPSLVPAGFLQTEAQQTKTNLQSVLQIGPNQLQEFDPGGKEELNKYFPDGVQSSDSVRTADSVAYRMQTQFWEDNIIEVLDFASSLLFCTDQLV